MNVRMFPASLAVAVLSSGCPAEEVVPVPFSQEGRVRVQLVDDEAACDAALEPPQPLISTVASNEVADITITPQCGVAGTSHSILVALRDPESHQSIVIGATLTVERGDEDLTQSFELAQDSAVPSEWGISLDSFGPTRTDTFVFQLLQPEQLFEDP